MSIIDHLVDAFFIALIATTIIHAIVERADMKARINELEKQVNKETDK
ncbi:hypothetical protein [Aeromonas dhakensis]